MRHTVYRPGEDGDAVRSRCRASLPQEAPGCAEHPRRDERGHQLGVVVVKNKNYPPVPGTARS